MPPAIATLETSIIFRHRSETSASSSSRASIREISSIGLSSSIRFKIEIRRCAILELRWSTSRRAGSARHDLLVQFLIYDLDRAVDLRIGHAKLIRNQLHQQVDPLNEGRSTGHRASC